MQLTIKVVLHSKGPTPLSPPGCFSKSVIFFDGPKFFRSENFPLVLVLRGKSGGPRTPGDWPYVAPWASLSRGTPRAATPVGAQDIVYLLLYFSSLSSIFFFITMSCVLVFCFFSLCYILLNKLSYPIKKVNAKNKLLHGANELKSSYRHVYLHMTCLYAVTSYRYVAPIYF